MSLDTDNQIGSFQRSASWQITHLVRRMKEDQRQAFATKIMEQEAINRVLGRPIDERLLAIAKKIINKEVVQ
jgi:hypothetical protein